MNEREFIARYTTSWETYEGVLNALGGRANDETADVAEFPFLYRQLCQQLALARERNYSPALLERLNTLVLLGHRNLYQARAGTRARILRFIAVDFPQRLRADAIFFWVASLLLYGPVIVIVIAGILDRELAYTFIDSGEATNLERMYDPTSSHFAREREADSDFLMLGFYIKNNVGIGFQTYAGGLLLGVGSLYYLIHNGLFFGAATAHLFHAGYMQTFTSFVITHGAFELTAIVIAGAAGIKLGYALIAPGRRTRRKALRVAAQQSVVLVYGFTLMLIIAAFIEAYWSSSVTVPTIVKYGVGSLCWALVAFYFVFVGRQRGSE